MEAILQYALPALLYAGLAFHFWHSRWIVAAPAPGMRQWERATLLLALALHAIGLHAGLFGDGAMRFGFSSAMSLMLWLAVLYYWLESFHARTEGLQPLVLPVAASCALAPALLPPGHILTHTDSLAFRLHFLVAMLAYSLFTVAAIHAVFMAAVEKHLHRAHLTKMLASLPPLLVMESLLFRLIGAGFILLTAAVLSGSFFSEALFGRPFTFNHKTLFALASWLIFGALLIGRFRYGWRGRRALMWTLAGFLSLLLAYIGSRFVLEIILGRG